MSDNKIDENIEIDEPDSSLGGDTIDYIGTADLTVDTKAFAKAMQDANIAIKNWQITIPNIVGKKFTMKGTLDDQVA